jgi:Secretion system C-terminal sorting domain
MVHNSGLLNNYGNGEIANSNKIFLQSGSTTNNSAKIFNVNFATISIQGNLVNHSIGSVSNNDSIIIYQNGILTNNGEIVNNNQGKLLNNWDMYNNKKIINNGLLYNDASGYFFQNDSILGTSSITNDGFIFTDAEAYIQKDVVGNSKYNPGNNTVGKLMIDHPSQDFNGQGINFVIDSTNGYDQLITTGTSSLSGANIVISFGKYTPQPNDCFTFIKSSSFTTNAPTLFLPTIANPSLSWMPPTYSNGELKICISSAPLSITENTFRATLLTNYTAKLQWTSTAHQSNTLFDIETSTDGISFVKIGSVVAQQHNTNYEFIDALLLTGNHFYRIKTIEDHNIISYSTIEKIFFDGHHQSISIYPNPSFDVININGIDEDAIVELYDVQGKQLKEISVYHHKMSIAQLANGLYQLKIINKGVITFYKIQKL